MIKSSSDKPIQTAFFDWGYSMAFYALMDKNKESGILNTYNVDCNNLKPKENTEDEKDNNKNVVVIDRMHC